MTNPQLKEALVDRLQGNMKIWQALDLSNKDNAQVQRQAKEVYAEAISRICSELDK